MGRPQDARRAQLATNGPRAVAGELLARRLGPAVDVVAVPDAEAAANRLTVMVDRRPQRLAQIEFAICMRQAYAVGESGRTQQPKPTERFRAVAQQRGRTRALEQLAARPESFGKLVDRGALASAVAAAGGLRPCAGRREGL